MAARKAAALAAIPAVTHAEPGILKAGLEVASPVQVLALISSESAAALSPWAACGWTALGAAAGGFVMFASFKLRDCFSAGCTETTSDKEELALPSTSCGPQG
jgi:hypothetical protein